jgi:hypothetical protein
MLWLKIVHLVALISATFTLSLLFARWSAGRWRRLDWVTLVGVCLTFIAFMIIIIRDDF